jgi:glutamate/tyrosine decarboxylase-like PLP-dependent enzyme
MMARAAAVLRGARHMAEKAAGRDERAALDMSADEFRAAGHRLVDRIAEFYDSLRERPVTRGEAPDAIRDLVGRGALPVAGAPVRELLDSLVPLLCDHSLHNGHPRFMGYITSSGAPLGALADLLAAAVNPNVGKWDLAPVATEIEAQVVRWLAELVGFGAPCGGIMVSGGNMANFLGLLAARHAKAPWNLRAEGVGADDRRLIVYASRETHTWIEKAADLFGLGTSAIRWLPTDATQRLSVDELERQIAADRAAGGWPFLVVGTAGSVSTGAIDPLREIAAIARRHELWFHVDGAYGAPAAALPEAPTDLKALALADSVALDPHKWLYMPLEAACTLVRDPTALMQTFSYRPRYYHFDEAQDVTNFYEHGPQNSRGFRALKVWLCLKHVGRSGYERMIRDDIGLARRLFETAQRHAEIEARTLSLSIATFRYRPAAARGGGEAWGQYLDTLNSALLSALEREGECFVSNAVIDGAQYLRACIVNFRTRVEDVDALPEIVARRGRALDAELRPAGLR